MSAYALPGMFPPLESSSSTLTKSALPKTPLTEQQQENDVNIVVKDARIDSARLVQSLSSNSSSSRGGSNTGGCGSSNTKHASVSSLSSRQNQRKQTRNHKHSATHTVVPCTMTPQEDSMQFELSIMWNGKKYTAIRSFSTILKLRQELVRELGLEQSYPLSSPSLSTTTRSYRQHQFNNNNSNSNNSQFLSPNQITPQLLKIPEVPRLADDDESSGVFGSINYNNHGVVGRGFSFLQSMLSAYTPKLEGWLRQVTSIIQPNESPSLSSFLCEELRRLRSDAQLDASLDSIEETEHDDLDE